MSKSWLPSKVSAGPGGVPVLGYMASKDDLSTPTESKMFDPAMTAEGPCCI